MFKKRKEKRTLREESILKLISHNYYAAKRDSQGQAYLMAITPQISQEKTIKDLIESNRPLMKNNAKTWENLFKDKITQLAQQRELRDKALKNHAHSMATPPKTKAN